MSKYGDNPGERIRIRRKELRRRVEDVAPKAGLRPSTLYEIENGRQNRSTRMHALCVELGLRDEYVETGKFPRLLSEVTEAHGVKDSQARYMQHGTLATREEVEFGAEWGKLDEPEKSLVQQLVISMVGSKVRRERAARKDPPGDGAPQPRKSQQ